MAISVVQTTAKQRVDNGTSLNYSITGVTSGNSLFVVVIARRSAGVDSGLSVSDGDGTYSKDVTRNQSNTHASIHRLENASSGSHSITVNGVSSGTWIVSCAVEVSGLTSASLDKTAAAGSVSAAPSSGATATTTDANELLIGCMAIANNQASITVESLSPAWVEQVEELSVASHIPGEGDTRIVSATGAYTATWAAATSGAWSAVIATYKESSGGGGGGGTGSVGEGGVVGLNPVFGGRIIR